MTTRSNAARAPKFGEGPPRGRDALKGRLLNAMLALDFNRKTARRYVVRTGFGCRPFVVQELTLEISGQPHALGVEHVRRTGKVEL